MNLKFAFVVNIVVLHSFLIKECCSRPFWEYIFSEAETSTSDDKLIEPIDSTTQTDNVPDKTPVIFDDRKKVEEKSVEPVVDQGLSTNGAQTSIVESPKSKLDNGITQMTLMGGITRLLGRTVDGTRRLVDRGTDRVSDAIKTVAATNAKAFDSVTGAIDRGGQRVDDRINSWTRMFEASRRMFSGSAKKDADQAHSFTIKMSSKTPMNSLTGLLNGGSAWPEVTGFETNLFG